MFYQRQWRCILLPPVGLLSLYPLTQVGLDLWEAVDYIKQLVKPYAAADLTRVIRAAPAASILEEALQLRHL